MGEGAFMKVFENVLLNLLQINVSEGSVVIARRSSYQCR